MTDTMNDMSPEEKHSYDRYMLEVMQMEYDKREEMLREVACITCGTAGTCDACYERDERDAEVHVFSEHTNVNASETVADANVTRVSNGRLVWYGQESALLCWRCDREAEYAGYCEEHYAMRQEENTLQELLEHDEWVEDAYSQEELERLSAEREEDRNDH